MTAITSAATGVVLSLKGVSKRFRRRQALTDVDLDVHAREVVAVVGDNGAGKSTLIKAIAGVHPDEGTMTFDGSPVSVSTPAEAHASASPRVFQDLALCDNLDVVANLFLGRRLRQSGGALDEVEMERASWDLLRQLSAKMPSVHLPWASLSGGQRQAVAIARSLLGEPKV